MIVFKGTIEDIDGEVWFKLERTKERGTRSEEVMYNEDIACMADDEDDDVDQLEFDFGMFIDEDDE